MNDESFFDQLLVDFLRYEVVENYFDYRFNELCQICKAFEPSTLFGTSDLFAASSLLIKIDNEYFDTDQRKAGLFCLAIQDLIEEKIQGHYSFDKIVEYFKISEFNTNNESDIEYTISKKLYNIMIQYRWIKNFFCGGLDSSLAFLSRYRCPHFIILLLFFKSEHSQPKYFCKDYCWMDRGKSSICQRFFENVLQTTIIIHDFELLRLLLQYFPSKINIDSLFSFIFNINEAYVLQQAWIKNKDSSHSGSFIVYKSPSFVLRWLLKYYYFCAKNQSDVEYLMWCIIGTDDLTIYKDVADLAPKLGEINCIQFAFARNSINIFKFLWSQNPSFVPKRNIFQMSFECETYIKQTKKT